MVSLARLVRQSSLIDDDMKSREVLKLVDEYRSFANDIDFGAVRTPTRLNQLTRLMRRGDSSKNETPKNLIIFIRDQVKPTDLWFPKTWAEDHLPTQRWLQDNGLTISNSFTNTSMCSVSRSTFFTSKYPAQHQADLLLSDVDNPVLDSQVQLNPDLPNLGNLLSSQGYDVAFFGKYHLSKTITLNNGETLYQNPGDYGFKAWQGPDAGQDTKPENAGLGPNRNDPRFIREATSWLDQRLDSGKKKPYAMVVSLVNPHDVLAYPDSMEAFEYSDQWLKGDIDLLPPTFSENKEKNYKPKVQTEWTLIQDGNGQLFNQKKALNYLNFYGNLLKVADRQIGEVVSLLRQKGRKKDLRNTMFVSTSDHGEMAMSHGRMTQKMFNAYEEAIKVPLIWSNPYYFKGGQSTDALVSAVDFLPTALNFLSIDRGVIDAADLRGVDYSRILRKANKSDRKLLNNVDVQDSILYTYDDIYAGQNPHYSADQNYVHGLLPANNRLQALRSKDFKYVRYFSGDQIYNPKNWEGEFYDLRPGGGDYYPKRDTSGALNPFYPAPLEMKNLDPKAEAKRERQFKRGKGQGPLASPEQQDAYQSMSRELDVLIQNKLQPLPQSEAVAPTYFRYNGGTLERDGSNYKKGDPIVRFFPRAATGTVDLELAFVTRASQTYNITYQQNGENITAIENIAGTNGPTYQYISGLPGNLTLNDISVEWIGDTVTLAEMA